MNTSSTSQHLRKQKYYPEISFIRAIACLCVVMVHVTAGYYYTNGGNFNWLTQFLNQISRYGTPAFAIISGFLLYNQAINRKFKVSVFWKSRISKVISPFIIWSIIYLFVKWCYGKYSLPTFNSLTEINDFIYYFFSGKSNYHLYFIAIVVQFYLIFPLLQMMKSKKPLIFLTIIGFFINHFIVNYNINLGNGFLNEFINGRVFIFHWIFYFFLGGLLVYYWDKIITLVKQNIKSSLLIGLIIIFFGVIEYRLTGWIESNRTLNMFNLPLLFISISGLYIALSSFKKIRSYVVEIGNLSMGIYLVHPLILFFLRNHSFFDLFYERTRYLPVIYIFTLVSSIILVKIVTKIPFGSYIVTVAKRKDKVIESTNSLNTRSA
ncbi:acyltransferase [Oceanobacillus picturae]|uniref:acyltransferase n=1 Tax=Oceanobacillus picturae TaxID=171693 RepID=UPI000E67C380|nr:acyltransferase [Oceanobacillus picturae]